MEFEDNQPIYLQICDWVCEKILRSEWSPDERILSVRELGALLEVNPNTVMRTYDRLQAREIIYNRRGIGYYVAPDAGVKIRASAKRAFFDEELPHLFERMHALEITIEEVQECYRMFQPGTASSGEKEKL